MLLTFMLFSGCSAENFQLGLSTLLAIDQTQPEPNSPSSIELLIPVDTVNSALAPLWEPADCRFRHSIAETITCGYVVTPERWEFNPETHSGDGERTVRLYVAVVHSRSETPADPVIYLSGGPGSRTFPFVDSITSRFDPILDNHDLILYDQRGIHFSEPSLNCPEITRWKTTHLAEPLARADLIAQNIETNLACLERLKQSDIDVTAYSSEASAADIEAIRQALGYEQLNLYGVSYGSRLALTAMRTLADQATIRSVILDSTYSPEVDLFEGLSPNAQRSFSLLFDRCEADSACRAAFPQLEQTYYDLVKRLTEEPVTIEVIGRTRNSQPFIMSLDGQELIRLVFNMLYDTDTIPRIPSFIAQMDAGDFSNRQLQGWLRWLIISGDYFSEGMWYSVMCGEEARFGSEAQVRAAGEGAHPAIQDYFIDLVLPIDFSTCAMWGANPAQAIENEPVQSNIPTLILAGEFDPITPPAWGRLAAASLSRSTYVEFPNVGHGILRARPCARELSALFLQNPDQALDLACSTEQTELDFVIQ